MIASVLRPRTLAAAVLATCALAPLQASASASPPSSASASSAVPASAASEAGAAGAQADASVSSVDIQRLQDRVYSLNGDLSRLRGRDSAQASRLEADLDDLRDEVIYLKVKLRKEGRVPRAEYADLRDRLDNLGARIRGESTSTSTSTSTSSAGSDTYRPPARGTVPAERPYETRPAERPADTRPVERDREYPADQRPSRTTTVRRSTVPVGTELDIRLQTPLSSETAQVEDRFEATTIVDLIEGDQVMIPAGSVLRGVVSSVKKAGRVERKGSMTLSFDQLTVDGRDYTIRATVTQALESGGYRSDAGKIGAGAGVGAIIGGILGGFKGALAGILIGGGGTIAATEGTDVKLDTGTILRVRFDSPVSIEPGPPRR